MHIKSKHLLSHETKKHQLKRFVVAVTILLFYTAYLVWDQGANGFSLGIITWSAFVLATPLPDGGLILDFPIRLLTGIRMIYTEIFVWIAAILANIFYINLRPEIYDRTIVTHAFKMILVNPWPNWIVIVISGIGTFLGLYFGDELLDLIFHHQRKKYKKMKIIYRFIFAIFLIVALYYFYKNFLKFFGIEV